MKNVKEMSDEELKKEHEELGKRLEKLREERMDYEVGGWGAGKTADEVAEIDREMERIRERQRELYGEYMRRKKKQGKIGEKYEGS